MGVMWDMEDVKVEIEISDGENYIASTENEDDKILNNISVTANDNDSSNPFGICGSKSYELSIFDKNDYLSPTNTESPYYDKIKTGTKLRVYVYDNDLDDWRNDGTYYITSISGGFTDGYCDEVYISCQDRINNIGSNSNPKIQCLRNIRVDDFLGILLSPMAKGVDWDIDDKLGSKVLLYGITVGDKIRDTLNALAQFLQATVTINRDNKIIIRSATKIYGETYNLPSDCVSSITNAYSNSTNYSKVTITYSVDGSKVVDILLNDSSYTFKNGSNTINNIIFYTKALSIHSVHIEYDKNMYNTVATITGFNAYQDGMTSLTVELNGENIEQCTLYVEGASINKSTRTDEKVIYESENDGTAIDMEIKYIIKQSEANSLLNNLTELVNKMLRQIVIKTLATPHIDLGDRIVLDDDGFSEAYKGSYRVIRYSTVHGQDYTNTLTLIRE